ncbi:hypothetical protein M0804_013331 [Polistes exclamans]|nr:hypothetical protein M0804_013331 [Polistes exclamans]
MSSMSSYECFLPIQCWWLVILMPGQLDLTWGTPSASVYLSDWRVDEAESLLDQFYVSLKFMHEATGFRSLRSGGFPKLKAKALDDDMLTAALVSGEWSRSGCDISDVRGKVQWVRNTLTIAFKMAIPRV